MIKKLSVFIILCFLIMGAASAAHDFKINDGFTAVNEYYSVNDENGMRINTWDYDDELTQESYLQNDTDYRIVPGDGNTYNVSYNSHSPFGLLMTYMTTGNVSVDHGILEIAEIDGDKYIIMAYMDDGTKDDWKLCFDELMKFNENNNIEPLADAI